MQISHHSISARSIDLALLLGCLQMLSLYGVAFDILGQWSRAKICNAFLFCMPLILVNKSGYFEAKK